MSLRLRLALLFAVVVAIGIGIASAAAYFTTERALRDEIDDFLVVRADEINEGVRVAPAPGADVGGRPAPADGPGDNGSSGDAVDAFIDIFAFDPDSVIQVIDEQGEVIGRQGGSLPVDETDLEIARGGKRKIRNVRDGRDRYRVITRHLDSGGAVQVGRELDETNRVLQRLGNSFALIGLGLALVAAAAGWIVARGTTRPLRRLTDAAQHIAQTQDLNTPIPVDRDDEVGRLAQSLDTMTAALATSREQQHRLVMDAGHELRTPLTSLRTNVELLDRMGSEVPPDQRSEIIEAVTSEVDELSALVTELVELATDTRDDEPPQPVSLATLVDGAVARLGRRSGRDVTVAVDDSVVLGRATMLDRALSNLLANADKFAPPGTPIEVTVRDGSVVVRDHGEGFVVEDLPQVFQRFYRADAARTMPGSGLGLAIVAQIVERHGGTAHAANAPDGGAVVGFDLPTIGG